MEAAQREAKEMLAINLQEKLCNLQKQQADLLAANPVDYHKVALTLTLTLNRTLKLTLTLP